VASQFAADLTRRCTDSTNRSPQVMDPAAWRQWGFDLRLSAADQAWCRSIARRCAAGSGLDLGSGPVSSQVWIFLFSLMETVDTVF